jgi:hypothetical protein
VDRLCSEPRPFVVGIAWVVECVEQRARVDEEGFRIDLNGVNVAGTNKVCTRAHSALIVSRWLMVLLQRRRSMLPRHIPADVHTTPSSAQSPVVPSGSGTPSAADRSVSSGKTQLAYPVLGSFLMTAAFSR